MSIRARLRVCFEELICTAPESEQFRFEAELAANYFGTGVFDVDVTGAAGLDFDSLRAPTVTDTGNAAVGGSQPFYRTVTVNFSDFTGHLDLGEIPAGKPLTIEYDMTARGEGRLIDNIGLAGINDPFILDTDRLPVSQAMTLVLVPVPEPGEYALLLAGGILVGCRAWRLRPIPRCDASPLARAGVDGRGRDRAVGDGVGRGTEESRQTNVDGYATESGEHNRERLRHTKPPHSRCGERRPHCGSSIGERAGSFSALALRQDVGILSTGVP
jgi:hypothetical protein